MYLRKRPSRNASRTVMKGSWFRAAAECETRRAHSRWRVLCIKKAPPDDESDGALAGQAIISASAGITRCCWRPKAGYRLHSGSHRRPHRIIQMTDCGLDERPKGTRVRLAPWLASRPRRKRECSLVVKNSRQSGDWRLWSCTVILAEIAASVDKVLTTGARRAIEPGHVVDQ